MIQSVRDGFAKIDGARLYCQVAAEASRRQLYAGLANCRMWDD